MIELKKSIQALTVAMVEVDDIAEDLLNQKIEQMGLAAWEKLDFQEDMKIRYQVYREAQKIYEMKASNI